MSSSGKHLRAFDRFQIDLETKILWYEGKPVHVPPKAVELLCELVERRGEVISKDELLVRVWHDSFVEENVLAQNIHHLRKAFRDLDLKHDPIQTIPRRGYRFAGNVQEPDDIIVEHEIFERSYLADDSEDSLRDLDPADGGTIASTARQRFRHPALIAILLLLPAALIAGIYVISNRGSVDGDPNIRSVAVLPLRTLGPRQQHDKMSLALTDALITELGRLNKFAVRPFSSVEKFDESGEDAIEFGRRLRVDSVIEGTVQHADERLRVNLRLISVHSGTHLWSGYFDETESDILKLQTAISNRVARAMVVKLGPREEEQLGRSPTTNADAYQYYVMGRERWLRRDLSADSLAFYRKAIELDPNFALPYLGIADQVAFSGDTATAEQALNRAMEIDPGLGDAYATRGFLQMFRHWDWDGAEMSFRHALELTPNSSKAHHWYGVCLALRGRLAEAESEMNIALELNPTASIIMADIAELHYFRRDYDRAEAELLKVIENDPSFNIARQYLVKVRHQKGSSFFIEDAQFHIFLKRTHSTVLPGDAAAGLDEQERILSSKDEQELRARHLRWLEWMRPVPNVGLARYHLITGDIERSLASLETACSTREFLLPFIAVDPLWDPIRAHPRFIAVLQQIGLGVDVSADTKA